MKQSEKQGKLNQIGAFGEQIAANYLKKQSLTIVDVNYLKKWGEIDIVARETGEKSEIIHFVEVKTVSYETKADLQAAVSRATWRPEENVTREKLQRLQRTISSWLQEKFPTGNEPNWQIDVVAVRLVTRERFATVKYLPNIILD